MARSIFVDIFADLKLIFLDPRSERLKFIAGLLAIPFFTISIAAFLELFYHRRFEIDFVALFLETQALALQANFRLIALPLYRKKMLKIVAEFDTLKSEFAVDVIERHYVKNSRRLGKIFSSYKLICSVIIVLNLSKPFLYGKKDFPYFLYKSDRLFPPDFWNSPYFYAVYALEMTHHYVAFVVFVGLDIMYIVFSHELYTHLQILKYRLENLENEHEALAKIGRYVHYHIRLINLGKDINAVFSLLLLSQFVGIAVQFGVGLYMLVYDGTLNVVRISNSLSKLIGYNFEFFIFCFWGTVLNNEFYKIGYAAYFSKWETENHPKVKKALLLVMQYSQRDFHFTILNFIKLTLNNIISVWQTTFSIYTLLQGMKKN